MADILCPNCKRNNPDFLEVCQFCQTPLTPEAMVHTGEKPTKKQTGELEPILPEWLRDIRQQSKDATAEDTANAADIPSKIQKNEPPDLLAGLASQTGRSDDEDVPDWLANLNPAVKPTPSAAPAASESETDFFAQFNKGKAEPASPSASSAEKDELSEWFSQASEQPVEPVTFERDDSRIELGWMDNFDSPASTPQEPAQLPKEKEDLSWLRDLEASAKRTGELSSPKPDVPSAPQEDLSWLNTLGGISPPSQPDAPKEDLSWLDNLGGTPQPSLTPPQEDLSWLNNLGGTSEPSQRESPKEDLGWLKDLGTPSEASLPATSQSSAPQEDLSWLKDLGGTSEPAQPAAPAENMRWLNNLGESQEPASPVSPPTTPQEDISWLNNMGRTPESVPLASAQPSSASQEDLGWLNELSGTTEPASTDVLDSESASHALHEHDWLQNTSAQSEDTSAHGDALSPRPTGPLGGDAQTDMPDWLKSATEEPSLPLGVGALDKLRETTIPSVPEQPADDPFAWLGSSQESQEVKEEKLSSTPEPFDFAQDKPATIDTSLFAPTSDSTLSNQDVDSLLSMDLPDWLSRPEPSASEVSSQETAIPTSTSPGEDETLAPVELPSWVQAMRPVEAVAETTSTVDDQPTEREGPLAGLRGLIPIAPIGSARRPKQISLKLQATDEQQAGAALLEQILAGETSPRTILTSSAVMAQNVLRWALSGLMLIALGAMILLGTQTMPVSPALPIEVSAVSSAVVSIPENSHVLVVIDYEPSLAGEMEAISGPLLDQIALLRHPQLSFLSTSPNGSALAERLMTNANINQPSPAGLGYNIGENYFNLGYLPGGAAGVLEFVESPQVAIPSSSVSNLSGFSAIVVLTDHAESGRVWVEQLQSVRQTDPLFPALANQPLLIVSSAQAGPLLQPYVASGQITGLINGLSDASRYEFINNSRPGTARSYWDAFGVGLIIAVAAITLGSLWSIFAGIRARRAEAEQG